MPRLLAVVPRAPTRPRRPLFSCEHGGCDIPSAYAALFAGKAALLESHRGFDRGALPLARALTRAFGAPCIASKTSRLLVDLNRSRGHPRLFSTVTKKLPPGEREAIVGEYYEPHRARIEREIRRLGRSGAVVVHLAIHSFTPRLAGVVRRADIGLLYDPKRAEERLFCRELAQAIRAADAELVVRKNYPYRGAADGLTTALRKRFSADQYLGIEIEMNQRFSGDGARVRIERALCVALRSVLDGSAGKSRFQSR